MRRSCGFTLIEIAVVIAIISMLAAAMFMTGNSVFGRSGTAALLANIHDLGTAAREFKKRYSYFPGDLPYAGKYVTGGGAISPGCDLAPAGNLGNGIVDTVAESNCALEHLVKAGMLRSVNYNSARNRYEITLDSWGTGTVYVSLWFDATASVNAVRIGTHPDSAPPVALGLPCEISLEMDRKLDSATSGNTPFAEGSVRARNASDTAIDTCAPGTANDPVPTLLIRY